MDKKKSFGSRGGFTYLYLAFISNLLCWDDGGRLPRPESLKFSGDKGDSLDQRDNFYWRNTPHPLSNVSSVGMEEVIEDIIRGSSKAIEKTGAEALESKSKSPKYFPKFLRSSFSRLISRDKSKTGSLSGGEPVSIPSLSSPSPSLYLTDTSSDTLEDPLASSPTTQQFVEDTLARGFPLIPFHYTSSESGRRSSLSLITKWFGADDLQVIRSGIIINIFLFSSSGHRWEGPDPAEDQGARRVPRQDEVPEAAADWRLRGAEAGGRPGGEISAECPQPRTAAAGAGGPGWLIIYKLQTLLRCLETFWIRGGFPLVKEIPTNISSLFLTLDL